MSNLESHVSKLIADHVPSITSELIEYFSLSFPFDHRQETALPIEQISE